MKKQLVVTAAQAAKFLGTLDPNMTIPEGGTAADVKSEMEKMDPNTKVVILPAGVFPQGGDSPEVQNAKAIQRAVLQIMAVVSELPAHQIAAAMKEDADNRLLEVCKGRKEEWRMAFEDTKEWVDSVNGEIEKGKKDIGQLISFYSNITNAQRDAGVGQFMDDLDRLCGLAERVEKLNEKGTLNAIFEAMKKKEVA